MGARAGFVVLVALLAGGCSGGGTSPGGSLSTTPAQASTSAHRKGDAPAVPEPLDIEELVDDPCAALTAEQLAGIGITDPGAMELDHTDNQCRWHVATSTLHLVSLTAVASETDGLSHLYATREYQQYFEPTEVDGFPAVYAGVLDQRASGNCELWVGVTDELAVDIATHFLETDPCPVAERVAAGMVAHARGGA